MHVDLNKEIKDIHGQPLEQDGRIMTLASAIATSLVAPEQGTSSEEQLKRFILATRIYGAKLPVELTIDEAAMIKKCVARICGPLATGPICIALEEAASAPAKPNGTHAHPN